MTTVPPTLLADTTLALATAALFAYVGALVARRPVADREDRRAVRLFAVWWIGLAAVTLLGAARTALAISGNLDVGLHATLSDVAVVPLVALLWGLVYYLAYIYTGNARLFWPITVLHLLILGFLLYVVATLRPESVVVNDWSVPMTYQQDLAPGVVAGLLGSILVPTLLAALGYGTLYFRAQDRTSRYRIALTSGAFLYWFGMATVSAVTPLGQWYWWPLLSRLDGLVATLMILLAYRPPRWLEERLGVRGIETPTTPDARRQARLQHARPLRG